MNIHRAIRQQLQALELAGLEQLSRRSPQQGDALLQRLQHLTRETTETDCRGGVNSTTDNNTDTSSEAETGGGHGRTFSASTSRREIEQRLEILSAQVASCQLCPQLVANRTKTVFGVGNPQARFCFFGEGPGADEDRQGEPFVGAAGQLLDKIIAACQLKRADVYILNTVKCRPPGNRNPEPDEISNCRGFFEQQLEIIQPEFIICLGKVAANTLLDNDSPVGRLRGRLHSWRSAQVAVTYHPAYLLRNAAAKKPVWEDMKMVMRAAGRELS